MDVISIKELMGHQFSGDEFFRYDIIVKYMAIEDLANGGDVGIDTYNRMYSLVNGRNKTARRMKAMKEMLDKFDTSTHPIVINKRNHVRDGSHRLAMACYLGVAEIHYRRTRKRGGGKKRQELTKVFSDEEMATIDDKKHKMLEKIGL